MTTKNIFIIDSRVTNYQNLIAGLPADSAAFVLDPGQDGITQMQAILANHSQLDSIQIISHGAQGALYLGNTLLNSENIENYRSQLGDIGNSLTATGDLLLYGCNVAQGDQGRHFVDHLAQFTGADVAASDDWTGNAALGGNWRLEARIGAIETASQALVHEGLLGLTVSPNTPSYPGHTLGEYLNGFAFAAIKEDGSVVTWGSAFEGGDSSSVADKLDGTIDVKQIYSTPYSFAALRTDGSVITWGFGGFGGDSSSVANQLDGAVDVKQIYSSLYGFAALRADGSVITWGHSIYAVASFSVANQLDGTVDVTQIYSVDAAFAALRADGSVVTWGDSMFGGDSSSVANQLDGTVDVTKIYPTQGAFAALRADGSVITWGHSPFGGDSSKVANQLDGTVDVMEIYSAVSSFAALRTDGSVITWGGSTFGGDSTSVASELINVKQIYSTFGAFAALRADGSVIIWGFPTQGGDNSSVANQLDGTVDVTQIFSTSEAFAALRVDGSVITWGNSDFGGDSSSVANELDGTVDVTQIYSTSLAFAALRADGSVVTWGDSFHGGDSSSVASALDGTVDVVQIYSTGGAFAALRADGSTITWGNAAYGGDSSAVASQLSSGVVGLADIYTDDFYTADPVWQITPNAPVVSESGGAIGFTITRPDDRTGTAETVYVSTTQNHGSVNTNDYGGLLNIPYSFAVGEASKTVTVDILADSVTEPDETFGLIVQTNPTDPITNNLASMTFTITENVIPPTNLPPTAQPVSSTKHLQPGKSIPLSELFTWNDPNGIPDVVSFAVRDRGIGGGYLTKNNGVDRLQDDQLFENVPIADIANWAFVAGEAGSADDVAFNAIDAAGAFNTPAAVATVTATTVTPPILQKPSEMELEYFARVLSYDNRLATADRSLIDVPFGYTISEVFINGTFQAVGLTSDSETPILAIRGTVPNSLFDWLENADLNGVGYQEFINAWQNTNLRNWLESHADTSITGHSQGGAQAQLLASEATSNGITLGKIVTFNSPGIENKFADKFDSTLVDSVKHWITSGDLVQLAGDTFIQGDIERYNFDAFADSDNTIISNVFLLPLNSHTNHWSNQDFFLTSPYRDHQDIVSNYRDFEGSLTYSEFSSPGFSYLYSGGKTDVEYFGFLVATAALASAPGIIWPSALKAGPYIAKALSNRESAEDARTDIGMFLEILYGITDLGRQIMEFGQTIWDRISAAIETAKTWALDSSQAIIKAVATWTEDTWEGVSRFSADVWEATRELTTEAWLAISKWTANRWEETKDWTVETWQKTKNWTVDVWEATVSGTKDFFNALKEKTADAVNALIENGRSIIDSVDPQTQVTSPLIFGFLSKNESAEVVVPENGVATAPAETPAIFFGIGNSETFNGGSSNYLFFGGGGNDIYNFGQTQTSTPPTLRTLQNLAVFQADQQIASDILSQGSNIVAGTTADLDGDMINGFANDDEVFVANAFFTQNDLSVKKGSAILQADVDQNGSHDFTLTLKGEYELDQFVVETQELGTLIRYQGALEPVLVDDSGSVNEDSSVTFSFADLLANDLNVNGVNQTIVAVDTNGTAGSVVINTANQTITYHADADQFDLLANGATVLDSFKYVLQGNSGEISATVAINVTGVNDGKSLFGTVRRDTLNGTTGEDVIKGNNGNDIINGRDGADRLFGENGDDRLDGGNSIDSLSGGTGNDRLKGGNGDDSLTGGDGNDRLEGGMGNDWLKGDKGNDMLIGGAGSDIFAFAKAGGKDIVTDFIDGVDKIQIVKNTGVTNFSQLNITSKTGTGDVLYTTIDWGSSDKILLMGVSPDQLDATDFIFPV